MKKKIHLYALAQDASIAFLKMVLYDVIPTHKKL